MDHRLTQREPGRRNRPEAVGRALGDKTFLECVVREIYEEISYFLPSERFAHLIRYTGAHPLGGAFHCEIYVANNIPVDQLLITEGIAVVG